jgi:DivIVA domain-containing protein
MGNSPPSFTIVLRGYDRREVDRAVDQVLSAAGRVAEPPRFPVALRGYARNHSEHRIWGGARWRSSGADRRFRAWPRQSGRGHRWLLHVTTLGVWVL